MIRVPGQKLNAPVTFPAVLSKSRDYNAIELLLQTLFNYFYVLSEESRNIHNPRRCNVNLLPLLAQYYRYEYTDVQSVAMEREIMASVPELHHNKGTVIGVDNALALSKIDKENEVSIPWFYTKETNTITVIALDNIKTYKMLELLNLVIPLGTKVVLKPGFFVKSSEEVRMHSWTEINVGALSPDKQYYIQPNNFWHTTWDQDKQLYHTYVDTQWALGDPTNTDPQGLGKNGATRVGGTEVASNDFPVSEES
nr:hypothetical protein DGKKSRWO_DGKKSRWO_CDS_0018 [uncultured phage]CAI9752132.1 hypothetical protein CVNMHQAP_CVNMHQAP_CDS_0018 [uncultured phage]